MDFEIWFNNYWENEIKNWRNDFKSTEQAIGLRKQKYDDFKTGWDAALSRPAQVVEGVKRYYQDSGHDVGGPGCGMHESVNGDWVKYSDIAPTSSAGMLDLDTAIAQMDKCVKCLALELHEAVQGDVEETWFRLKTAIRISHLSASATHTTPHPQELRDVSKNLIRGKILLERLESLKSNCNDECCGLVFNSLCELIKELEAGNNSL